MAAFKCKNCGGNLIPVPGEEGRATCDSCFCSSIIPSITNERRTDQHNRGIDFRRARKFEEALQEFGSIVKDNPKDAEAHWDMMLSRYGINYEKDYRSGEYIPTCDRLSDVSVFDDPDYKAAIQYAKVKDKSYYQEQAQHIEKIRLGMIALAAKAEAYDVFICFKDTVDGTKDQRTEDSHLAHEIYMELTNKGYHVFFSRVTLKQEHLGQEWEPVIYSALNTAKIMLVVGTSRANIESPWVKNEWTRFLAVRSKDKTKSIITCYDSRTMTTDDIPPELGALEAIDLRDNAFFKYIQQTVFTHCSKAETKTSAVQQKSAGNYAKRGLQSLEDGDWTKADKMLEEALDLDPENGEAHVGKLLLSLKCRSVEELSRQTKSLSSNSNYSRVIKYAAPERKNQIMAIDQMIKQRLEEQSREKAYADYVDRFDDLETSEEAGVLAADFDRMGSYKEAAKYAQRCREAQIRMKEEEERAAAERKAKAAAEAKRKAEEAEAEAKRKAAEEAERKRLDALVEKRKKRKKRRKTIRNVIFLLVIIGFIGYQFIGKKYMAAVDAYALAHEYEAQGDYKNATEQYFIAAKANYKDSEEKGLVACKNWLGWDPVVLSTDEYPWWGVDENGGLTYDPSVYDSSVEFALPTILDGELVNGIGAECFRDIEGLKSLNLPANYTWIGDRAFYNCYNLNAFSMQGVETIGEAAFYNCDSLTAIALSDNCVSVGVCAFEDCDYLNNLTLNAGLESIGEGAFRSCDSITSAYISGSVTYIGYEAFAYTPITALTLEEGVSNISERAFAECEYLTAVSVPGTVKEIGPGAFFSCEAINTVVIGSGVEVIGANCFDDCYALSSLTLGEGLVSINDYAFDDCGISGTLNIPAGVTYMGVEAFNNCDALYEIYVGETSGLTVGESCFYGCEILNGASFASGLVSLGNSAFDYCEQMTWVSLPEGLEYIGTWCFSNDALYSVTIPTTVTTIGEGAFNNCNNLEGVHVPGGVSIIETNTFAHCDNLWYLWFDEGISIIRDDATYGSDGLVNVCYSGSAESWSSVSVGNNERIQYATLYPNYTG